MSRIFLSHSTANNADAVALRDWLMQQGWDDVFLDLDPKRGIAVGENWGRRLSEAENRCEAVLFLVSRAWIASSSCRKELSAALRLNKRLFGLLIEPLAIAELPPELSGNWQVTDLISGQDRACFRVKLPRTQQVVDVSLSQEGLRRLRAGLVKAGLDPRFFAWPPTNDRERPPYRGLRPLEAEDVHGPVAVESLHVRQDLALPERIEQPVVAHEDGVLAARVARGGGLRCGRHVDFAR